MPQAQIVQLQGQLAGLKGGGDPGSAPPHAAPAVASAKYLRIWWLLQLAGLVAYWATDSVLQQLAVRR